MTVWRTGWGPVNVLLGRRQEGLTKMVGLSCLFHLFLFVFLILNNVFFGVRAPSFQGFQVNLVAPGFGSPGSASGGGGGMAKTRTSPKNGVIRPARASTSSRTSAKRPSRAKQSKKSVRARSRPSAPAPLPKRAALKTPVKSGPPPLPRTSANRTAVKAKAPVAAPSKGRSVLGKAMAPAQKDPERLEDWWRKQKRALKMPVVTPIVKTNKGSGQPTRTAKINIKRRTIVTPPVSRSIIEASGESNDTSREVGPQNESLSQPDTSEENHSGNDVKSLFSHEEGTAESSETEGIRRSSEAHSNETGSILASVGPGIKGIGTGTGRGGASFFFPSYLQTIDSKVRWQWAPPPIRSREDSLVVRFVINRDGSIDGSSIVIKESSGNSFFDQAGRRAILAARPLPPLPKAYSENSLIIYMNFIVKEDT